MEQLFWRSNRKIKCSRRAAALPKGKQSLRFAATGIIQIQKGFERGAENRIIY